MSRLTRWPLKVNESLSLGKKTDGLGLSVNRSDPVVGIDIETDRCEPPRQIRPGLKA